MEAWKYYININRKKKKNMTIKTDYGRRMGVALYVLFHGTEDRRTTSKDRKIEYTIERHGRGNHISGDGKLDKKI